MYSADISLFLCISHISTCVYISMCFCIFYTSKFVYIHEDHICLYTRRLTYKGGLHHLGLSRILLSADYIFLYVTLCVCNFVYIGTTFFCATLCVYKFVYMGTVHPAELRRQGIRHFAMCYRNKQIVRKDLTYGKRFLSKKNVVRKDMYISEEITFKRKIFVRKDPYRKKISFHVFMSLSCV